MPSKIKQSKYMKTVNIVNIDLTQTNHSQYRDRILGTVILRKNVLLQNYTFTC